MAVSFNTHMKTPPILVEMLVEFQTPPPKLIHKMDRKGENKLPSYLTTRPTITAKNTPQTQPIPGRTDQVKNSAGGYVFGVNKWDALDRFLILGTEGGSYYASQKEMTVKNSENVQKLIKEDGVRVVSRIREISVAGRAPKNDQAIYALAMCVTYGDDKTRSAAYTALNDVCRIGTHLFMFTDFCKALGKGWGRGLRNAVANWYTSKSPDQLGYQVVKYAQRDGWSHRDVLRLAHPSVNSLVAPERQAVLHYVVKGELTDGAPRILYGTEQLKFAKTAKEAARIITEYKLPREVVPTQFLGADNKDNRVVWEALLYTDMPMTAMIRNLANLTRAGVVGPLSDGTKYVMEQLQNAEKLQKARVHPIAVLTAMLTYKVGHGQRGTNTWTPVPAVVKALDDAFYLAFGAVEPAGKRTLIALDISGSMGVGEIAGVQGLTPRLGAAAMALVTINTEPWTHVVGFSHQLIDIPLTAKMSLADAQREMSKHPFGSTNAALPWQWALQNRVPVDTCITYTDNETYGSKTQHVTQAVQSYRSGTGIKARSAVVGMVANSFTIADPTDRGQMDFCGFDTAVPNLLSAFSRGDI